MDAESAQKVGAAQPTCVLCHPAKSHLEKRPEGDARRLLEVGGVLARVKQVRFECWPADGEDAGRHAQHVPFGCIVAEDLERSARQNLVNIVARTRREPQHGRKFCSCCRDGDGGHRSMRV